MSIVVAPNKFSTALELCQKSNLLFSVDFIVDLAPFTSGRMLVLTETAAGYSLFRMKNKKLLKSDKEDVAKVMATAEGIAENSELLAFQRFKVGRS